MSRPPIPAELPRPARRIGVRVAIATIGVGALITGGATIATAAPSHAGTASASAAAQALTIHQEVTHGTLLHTHGVRRVCRDCDAMVVTSARGATRPLSTAAPSGYGPSDLNGAYGITGTSTSTDTIAIIDAGVDPNLESDLGTYRSQYGLPSCTTSNGCLTLLNYDGGAQPPPQTSSDGEQTEEDVATETSLDVDMASAACPSCHIMEVSTPWADANTDGDQSESDFGQAVATAVAKGANTVSISYGYTPDAGSTSGTVLSDFNQKGVAITASTGDSGFNGGTHQSWPSDLPTVIAVGGTTLQSGSETAWSDGGSGCETYFPSATGQSSTATKDCGGYRAAADISSDADPNTGVAVYDTYAPYSGQPGDWEVVGGTSASSPYISGLFARGNNLSSVNGPNTLYAASSSDFNDITSGNNEANDQCANYPNISAAVCNAGPGWDGPTGLGSPHGLGAFSG